MHQRWFSVFLLPRKQPWYEATQSPHQRANFWLASCTRAPPILLANKLVSPCFAVQLDFFASQLATQTLLESRLCASSSSRHWPISQCSFRQRAPCRCDGATRHMRYPFFEYVVFHRGAISIFQPKS